MKLNNRLLLALPVFILFFSLISTSVEAKETGFEFYYQNINKVVQINDPEPEGWWDNAKSFVKKGINLVKKTWEHNISRKYITSEGKKLWYSKQDANKAYEVNRTKVQNEKHLISLMGKKSEKDLTNGQKAMLEVYRHSSSQAIKDRSKYSYLPKVKVILSDTTGFDNSQEFPDVKRDFWPYSHGSLIQMSSGRYDYAGSADDAKSTLVHEYAHSMDWTIKEFIRPYGKDGTHYANELSKPRAAFVEGWAEYNEMLDSTDEADSMARTIKKVRIEDKNEAGKYTIVSANSQDVSGKDLMSVEGINAMILYRMTKEIPNGEAKIFDAFTQSRWKIFRSLKAFTKHFIKNNPDNAQMIAEIVDTETHGKLNDDELLSYVGSNAHTQEYISTRNSPESTETNSTSSSQASEIATKMSTQDFSLEIGKIYNTMINSQKAYYKAIQSGKNKIECLKCRDLFLKHKKAYEGLKLQRSK